MKTLTARPPVQIELGGFFYNINTDFRLMVDFETAVQNANDKNVIGNIALDTAQKLFYNKVPFSFQNEMIYKMLWFYRCGKSFEDNSNSDNRPNKNKRYYDFNEDAEYIYAAFLSEYGINLVSDNLHWWEFRALFMALTDNTEFIKIMQYRGMDLSKIKDKNEKARIKKLQEHYALNQNKIARFANVEQRNSAYKNKIAQRRQNLTQMIKGG